MELSRAHLRLTMSITLPSDFIDILEQKFEKAEAEGEIEFNGKEATVEVEHLPHMDVQYMMLPSLSKRPDRSQQKKNPFLEPEPLLTIVEDFGTDNQFRLVFNKYPVVPGHFMLLTKEFKSQDTPLLPEELEAIYSVSKFLGNDWFAFYNCGPELGASQPHKHVQFMRKPLGGFESFADKLANSSPPYLPNNTNEPLQNGDLPFAHFVARLPDEDLTQDDLLMYYILLVSRAATVLRDNDVTKMSYNFLMTPKWMMVVPRKHGVYHDKLGLNSCGMMGLFLCKNPELRELVKEDGPEQVLADVCFPSTAGQKSDEYHY